MWRGILGERGSEQHLWRSPQKPQVLCLLLLGWFWQLTSFLWQRTWGRGCSYLLSCWKARMGAFFNFFVMHEEPQRPLNSSRSSFWRVRLHVLGFSFGARVWSCIRWGGKLTGGATDFPLIWLRICAWDAWGFGQVFTCGKAKAKKERDYNKF